jgi:Astacin (Peptidase family M12A)
MPERRASRGGSAKARSSGEGSDSGGSSPGTGEFAGASGVRTAFISGNTFRAKAVQYVVIGGDAIFEGDIVLGTADQVESHSGMIAAELRGDTASGVIISGTQFRWPNCTIPYDIDPGMPNQNRVTDAIAHWQSNTRFTFVLRTAANAAQFPDWVTFRAGDGCSSSVGRRGGQQFVNLGPDCSTGNAIHEIGHVTGMWHEQSREDRDAFVTINWANIQPGMEHNFDQHISDGDDVGAYDYGSIMHYPRNAFGVGGAETITPVDPNAQIGQRTALSPGDIATAGTLCPKTTKELSSETIKEHIPETGKELSSETIKEHIPETGKELSSETVKEVTAETAKEFTVETIKEVNPETVKEVTAETVKEVTAETVKEVTAETVKEVTAETVKEVTAETIKEVNTETAKEFSVETAREVAQPELPGQITVSPQVAGALPFAMTTPHAGLATGAAGAATGDPVADLAGQLASMASALAGLEARQAALSEQLALVLSRLGLQ